MLKEIEHIVMVFSWYSYSIWALW